MQGETDFFVIAPRHGVLVNEVKPLESINADGEGRWRFGKRDWVARSRFEQASETQHSIVEFLESRDAGPLGYPVIHPAWLTRVSKSNFRAGIGWHELRNLDAADLAAGEATRAIIRTRATQCGATESRGVLSHMAQR